MAQYPKFAGKRWDAGQAQARKAARDRIQADPDKAKPKDVAEALGIVPAN